MTGNTHILGGIASSLAFAQITHYDPIILVGASVFGALLPDICHTGSKIGRTFPLISKFVNLVFGHRTLTHSLLFLFLIAIVMNHYLTNDSIIAGIILGMISHYVLDMFTKKGIMLLFPLNIMVRFPITTRTGSKTENFVALILSILCLYLGFETVIHSI